jgi:hypothetical protein
MPAGQDLPGCLPAINHENGVWSVVSPLLFLPISQDIPMRILPAVQNGVTAAKGDRRTAGATGFSLNGTASAGPAAAAGAAMGIHSVDALLALQGLEDAGERRRRFSRRGNTALDLLDTLKVEILEGRIGLETLRRLEVTLKGLSERSGEAELDDVLDAIGLRVAVELAKRTAAAASAA